MTQESVAIFAYPTLIQHRNGKHNSGLQNYSLQCPKRGTILIVYANRMACHFRLLYVIIRAEAQQFKEILLLLLLFLHFLCCCLVLRANKAPESPREPVLAYVKWYVLIWRAKCHHHVSVPLLSERLVDVVSWQSKSEHGRETFIILSLDYSLQWKSCGQDRQHRQRVENKSLMFFIIRETLVLCCFFFHEFSLSLQMAIFFRSR